MLLCIIFSVFINTGQCAEILGVFMYPSISHQVVCNRITKELSLRGHQVTVVTPNPLKDSTLINLTEINVDFVYDTFKKNNLQDQYSKDKIPCQVWNNAIKFADTIADLELDSSAFRRLISNQSRKFDLILIHYFHPVAYGLAARFKAPIISICTHNPMSIYYDYVGNPNHPVLHPDFPFHFRPEKSTPLDKLKSIYSVMCAKFHHKWVFLPRTQQMATRYFRDIPYLGDLVKNVSMFFVYRNILLHAPKPNVPAILDLSFINIEEPKPLPDDLQKLLDEATEGVIYVSFGSNLDITRFGEILRNSILEALPELPYTVLLKSGSDDFPTKLSNIIVRKWYPQKDVLAHPNLKLFVTQGGLQSIEESILSEVPMVGIPIISDQPKNVRSFVELGIGEEVDVDTINKIVFKNTIIKVAQNNSYKEKIKMVRKILLDKSMTGLESAVWWCEYVIRHKGGKSLKSVAVEMSYIEYLLLDVIFFLFSIFVLIFICVILIRKAI